MSKNNKDKKGIVMESAGGDSTLQKMQDEFNEQIIKNSGHDLNEDLMKSLISHATGSTKRGRLIPRLAFAEDPQNRNHYAGIYKLKRDLLPDPILKQIRVKNFLIAAILRARGNTISMMGHIRKDRFDVGIEVDVKPEFKDHIEPEQLVKINERIDRFIKTLVNCGHTDGLEESDKMTLPEYLDLQTRNGLTFGRFATEIVYKDDDQEEFHRFRPVDVGTIYKTVKRGESAEQTRRSAMKMLEYATGVSIDRNALDQDEYSWVQVIAGTPRQAFTSKEMLVYNIYPSSDVEHNGYPVTPLDTALTSVTTFMSIEEYNKLYFQNGRAARGILVINSDEIDQSVIEDIKQQFNASINNVSNSFRTPIFGVSKEDAVNWVSTQPQRKDGEFQFLFDQTTRNILSAFNMSPDELPGFTHLSRGSNQQSLSECLDFSTTITTEDGLRTIDSILNGENSVNKMVWNGEKFVEARIFKTGVKKLIETKFTDGLFVKTSPDHRFKVVDEDGEVVWKQQKDLKVEDWVLTSKQSVDSVADVPKYKGKELTLEMMEVLGWLTGDGLIKEPKKRAGGYIELFYHQDKERDIWERHSNILKSFGLNPLQKEIKRSPEQIEDIKERYGFNSVSDTRLAIKLYNTDFVRELFNLGFQSSKEGKAIPSLLHVLPKEHRQSFLKGLFSADGHVCKDANGSVLLTMESDSLREQTKLLLLNLGIRINNYSGTTKELINGKDREVVETNNKILIKDKRAFFNQIGFLQKHKQPEEQWLKGNDKNKIPLCIQVKYCKEILAKDLPRDIKSPLYVFAKDGTDKRMTLQRLREFADIANVKLPKWLEDYNLEQITEIVDCEEMVEMADVTMYDDTHQFIANGIVVHNSNNEYKLIAARDTGIRPLILKIQDFLNEKLFPIIDPELSQLCNITIAGFDAQTKEQESVRLQQDMPIHYTYDEVMEEVEKDTAGPHMMGNVPFNERYAQVIDKYVKTGDFLVHFADSPSASVDPLLKYKRDEFWFKWLEFLGQTNPAALQAYMVTRADSMNILKMYLNDYLDEDDLD